MKYIILCVTILIGESFDIHDSRQMDQKNLYRAQEMTIGGG
jgi:hypothetical protein